MIIFEGSFENSSIGKVNKEICKRLSKVKDVVLVPFGVPDFTEYPELESLLIKNKDLKHDSFTWISHRYPPNFDLPDCKTVIIQPWECSAVPKKWVSLFNSVSEVWTPSDYVTDVYTQNGIKNVFTVPNGVDGAIYKPIRKGKSEKFNFLFVGGTIYRKGIDLLLRAYQEIYQDGMNLIIKDTGGDSFYKGMNFKNEIKELSKTLPITYIDSHLTEQEMASLYNSADCLVNPYRGEGFCLPILEAMACGLPVVATGGKATDYQTGYKIPYKEKSIGFNLSGELTKEGYILEPDYYSLVEMMNSAYIGIGRDKMIKKGLGKAREMSWDETTNQIMERL